ncbi:DUF417 family protein [Ancylobacter dichloromethanicus]|uniref:Membrane protein n=1 Tax=Ancylobacter dichloromethanicus TaxID=518825 RepID=A0A9W6JCP2_9HYPH|nr:DUF417 family protein [Ancylobacter dichloromethanicus]MBS7556516.1 DUF417 family protein [Ancylobacter dichloromethanicus]GLK73604.1 membrane protein [Ancylobacter dichloromethanicus]
MNDLLHTRFTVAERNSGSMSILAPLRWSLVVIFIWFGCMKFTSYEAHGIAGLIANSPFMSWLHVLFGIEGGARMVGVLELATAAALIAGAFVPVLSALGAAMSTATYVITLTFFTTTPGVFVPSLGGFPAISGDIGQFLLKDLVLLAASVTLLLASRAPLSK